MKLKTNQAVVTEKAVKLTSSIDEEIYKLKAEYNVLIYFMMVFQKTSISKDQIENGYNQLTENVKMFMLELQARQEQEKVEEEERKMMQLLLQKQVTKARQ